MNVSQLHERLRLELVRRIDRGLLTAASLSRQSGLQQPHISNFLHRKRRLGLQALDRVLAALALSVEDLLASAGPAAPYPIAAPDSVPIVSQSSAINDAVILPSALTQSFPLPTGSLEDLRPKQLFRRRDWQRFVAIGVTPAQAVPMQPVLAPNAIVVLDRHYTSLADYQPPRPNIYAVRFENTMLFRYVRFDGGRLILRPYSLEHPVQLVEIDPARSPGDYIVGRVCIIYSRA
jgi:hypothetical protein